MSEGVACFCGCFSSMLTVYMSILPLASFGGGGFQLSLRVSGVSAVTETSVGAPDGTPSGVSRVTFASSPKSTALAAETRNSYSIPLSGEKV